MNNPRLSLEPRLIHNKGFGVAQDNGTLNDVLELANISRPAIGLENLHRPLFDGSDFLSDPLAKPCDEILGEHRYIRHAFAQRGHRDRHDVQPIKEVLAKLAFAHELLGIAMGCRQDPNVDRYGLIAAHTFDFALLQHAQQGDLNVRRKVANFVQEDRTAICRLEASEMALRGARESAFFMAEELRRDERSRDCAAIDADKGTRRSLGTPVDSAGNEFFARSCLAQDEHGRVRERHFVDRSKHLAQRLRGADDFIKHR